MRKQRISWWFGVLIALLVAAGAVFAAEGFTARDKAFLRDLAQSNVAQDKMASLALQKGTQKDVRAIAFQMRNSHRALQSKLVTFSEGKDVNLPVAWSGPQKAEYNRLSKLSGDNFDKEFLRTQVRWHSTWMKSYNDYVEKSPSSEVRSFLAANAQGIVNHQTEFIDLADKYNVSFPQWMRR